MRAGAGAKAAAARRPGRGGGVRRRGAVVLLLALAYAAGLLMFVLGGRVSPPSGAEVASLRRQRRRRAEEEDPPRPGSVYRSHLVFERLWPAMRDDAAHAAAASSLASAASWRRSMVSARPPPYWFFFPVPRFSLGSCRVPWPLPREFPPFLGETFPLLARFLVASVVGLMAGFTGSLCKYVGEFQDRFRVFALISNRRDGQCVLAP